MWAFHQPDALKRHLDLARSQGRLIGFAPTMGALHAGHLSLIDRARADGAIAVCSIFVNPTQFNDPGDLERYPRTEAEDFFLLEQAGCDAVFLPPVAEVYPKGLNFGPLFSFGELDKTMEGEFRPGHFAGVAQVVYRLLQMVAPDAIYMGQKDYQQAAIVGEMIRQAGLSVRLVVCPTLREKNGLAMSSRNVRLTAEQRERAALLYQVLRQIREGIAAGLPVGPLETAAYERLASEPGFRPEYVRIIDGRTLRSARDGEVGDHLVACLACWVGEVRLIDNETVKGSTF
jgi:pantoate--beta-alanine ligase